MRIFMRRRTWGDAQTLARRARRVFGAPRAFQWARSRDVRIEPVRDGAVGGEWIIPERSGAGTILYFHGGGYVACSPATHRPITAGLARRARRRVFSADYRRAPEHRFPAALDDAIATYRWLLDARIEPGAIVVAGDSAGGGLVLAMLVRARDEALPLPARAVCFSPWTDLTATAESLRLNDGRCALFRPRTIEEFAAAYLGDGSPKHPYASPLFAELGGLPPVLLQVASTELLLDDARRVHERIGRAGGVSRLEIFDGVFHGWHMLDGLVPEAGRALDQAAAFMTER
jgi:acetyl esterase/lipase